MQKLLPAPPADRNYLRENARISQENNSTICVGVTRGGVIFGRSVLEASLLRIIVLNVRQAEVQNVLATR